MAAEHTVRAADAMKSVTISLRVTGQATMWVRKWIGLQLMALGARIIGCSVEVSS